MSHENGAEKGQVETRTELENILAEIDGTGEKDQAALPGLDHPPDDFDLVAKAASNLNERRRARGRPEGSANRRNAEMFDYLEARGFKAPELRLMEIISADPAELAKAIGGMAEVSKPSFDQVMAEVSKPSFDQVMAVVALQAKYADALMPYKFAKRQELKIQTDKTVRHVFVARRLSEDVTEKANVFNAPSVRQLDNSSQIEEIAEQDQELIPIPAAD
jgi:hypothetical protein